MKAPHDDIPPAAAAQIDALRAMAGHASVSLTIEITAHHRRHRRRRHFETDEAFAAYQQQCALYAGGEATIEWAYPTPIELWTGADVDTVIADMLALMEDLPTTPEDRELHRKHWGIRKGVAASVCIERTARGAGHLYLTNYLFVVAAETPYAARVELPQAIPTLALLRVIENYGKCDFKLEMFGGPTKPYIPLLASGRRIGGAR